MSALVAGPIAGRAGALAAARRLRAPDGRLLLGLAIVGVFVLAALGAGWLAPYNPHGYPAAPLATPSRQHLLGANDVGQDILSQLIDGARISLLVGFVVGIASTAIAWTLGLLSGLSRPADVAAGALIDLILVLPPLPLILLIAAYLGASLPIVIITLSLTSWAAFARIIRGQTQSERRRPYVEAAYVLGASPWRILLRHIALATLPTAVVKFVLTVQYAVVVQASLAFLGLGDPNAISWGLMLRRAAQSPLLFLTHAWLWWLVPPALAIALLVVGVALIGWSVEDRARRTAN